MIKKAESPCSVDVTVRTAQEAADINKECDITKPRETQKRFPGFLANSKGW